MITCVEVSTVRVGIPRYQKKKKKIWSLGTGPDIPVIDERASSAIETPFIVEYFQRIQVARDASSMSYQLALMFGGHLSLDSQELGITSRPSGTTLTLSSVLHHLVQFWPHGSEVLTPFIR